MEQSFYKKYDRTFGFIKKVVCPVIGRIFRFSGEKLPKTKGPKLILCNHNTDVDFMLLALMSDEPLEFVGTETMLRMSRIAGYIVRTFRVILHDKGSNGAATIKQMALRIKDGRNVVLFPEGNRSFDGRTGEISDAIGKIVRMTGATLVVYKLTGGYLTTPRWGQGIRKGRMKGSVSCVIDAKDLKTMSVEEIRDRVKEGLYTDAYKEQEEEKVIFKSKAPAEYLESLLFICPACRKTGTLVSKKSRLSCGCGFKMTLDEYGYLCKDGGEKLTITKAFEDQKEYLKGILSDSAKELLWEDDVRMTKLSSDHRVIQDEEKKLLVYPDRLLIGDKTLELSKIVSIDIVQRNRLLIHVKGEEGHLEILGAKTFNAVKYRIWLERSFP